MPVKQAFERATKDWRAGAHDQVIATCRAIVDAAPQHVDALNLLGLALYRTGAHAEALDALKHALGVIRRADILNNLGLVQRALKQQNDALESFSQAIALKPDYAEAHANLGRLLRQSGNRGGALKHLTRAVELNWQQPRAHSDLAAIYFARDDLENACQHFEAHFIQALPQIKLATVPTAKTDIVDESDEKPKVSKPELFGAALPAMKKLLDDARRRKLCWPDLNPLGTSSRIRSGKSALISCCVRWVSSVLVRWCADCCSLARLRNSSKWDPGTMSRRKCAYN